MAQVNSVIPQQILHCAGNRKKCSQRIVTCERQRSNGVPYEISSYLSINKAQTNHPPMRGYNHGQGDETTHCFTASR